MTEDVSSISASPSTGGRFRQWAFASAAVVIFLLTGNWYLSGIVEHERNAVQGMANLTGSHIWVGRGSGLSGYEHVDYLVLDSISERQVEGLTFYLAKLKLNSVSIWVRNGVASEVRQPLESLRQPKVDFFAGFSTGPDNVKWSLISPYGT